MKRLSFILMLLTAVATAMAQPHSPKYVFFFIGDGMGPNHVLLTEMYKAAMDGKAGRVPLCMTQFPFSGMAITYSNSNDITDSAAAGTALAAGCKTKNGCLGLDNKGKPVSSVAERLHQQGWAVGIATSVSIDHATPAAFYAHVEKRGGFYQIGHQLAKSGFDFFAGRGFYTPVDKQQSQSPNLYDWCEKNGYVFAHGYKEALAMRDAPRMIMLPEKDGIDRDAECGGRLTYAIDRQKDELTLTQITETAIAHLFAKNSPFFLMVEGGAIDWASHANDAATMVHEVEDFDNAIQVAFRFYREHPEETLIVVTADHETGGLSLGNSDYTLNLKTLSKQQNSIDVLVDEQRENEEFIRADIAKLNADAKLAWSTRGHTAAAVPVFAIGVGARKFSGWMNNTEIAPHILQITHTK